MGYDCYVRGGNKRPDVDWKDDASIAEFRAWMDGPDYFRRNLSGGTYLAEALIELDMGFDSFAYGEHMPQWPDADA
jgi:hypothetical protein